MNKPAKVTASTAKPKKPIDRGLEAAAEIEKVVEAVKESNNYGPIVWNAILTTIGIAILGLLAWQSQAIVHLQNDISVMKATRFTESDGKELLNGLAEDVTDVSTDIDKRLSLMENNVTWMRTLVFSVHRDSHEERKTFESIDSALPAPKPESEPAPPPPQAQSPEPLKKGTTRKYDIRQSIQRSLKKE